jgi:outer membrane protein assembly factor BamB
VGGTAGSLLALDGRTGAVAWSFATDSYPRPAAVANGLVYFTSNNGAIYALDANSGAVEWHGRSGGTFFGGPAVSDGVLYVNTYESQLVAYAPNADTDSAIRHVPRPSPSSLRPNMALKIARWQ